MDIKNKVSDLWNDINNQNWSKLPSYFSDDAVINWHNTNESFSVKEFVIANSEYPGNWIINTERLLQIDNVVISVVKVQLKGADTSFHATSFFKFNGNRIQLLDEYWGNDSLPPQWRIDKQIGKSII